MVCQASQPLPPSAPLQPWSWPEKPSSRLHINYASSIKNKTFLVVIDAYSKWMMYILTVLSATSETTDDKLRTLFATHGIPNSVVTDNATVVVSKEMKKFWQNNGIRHITASP